MPFLPSEAVLTSYEGSPTRTCVSCRANEFDRFSRKKPPERAMPRPLKQLNPYASWTKLFGATLRQLRLKTTNGEALTQADLGKLVAYSGATVTAVERGTLRPEEAFVEACERELNAGGVLRAFLPFVNTEWAEQSKGSGASRQPHLLTPAEVAPDPVAFRDPTYLENLADQTLEAKTLALRAGASDTGQGVVETVQLQ